MKMKRCNLSVLSVDAGGTSLKAALIANNSIINDSFLTVPVKSDGSPGEIKEAYLTLCRTALQRAARHHIAIDRAAICIPGPFDYQAGRFLMTHKYQSVYGMSLRPWLLEGLGESLPTDFLHDSTAFLLGACQSIPVHPYRRICGIIIGTGLGFASMIDEKIFQQPSGGPGISIFGRPYCGQTAEDYISKRGILSRYHQLADNQEADGTTPIEVKELADLARRGDEHARKVFHDTGTHLAAVLLPIVEEYHFELLILGGAISKSSDLFLPALKEGLRTVPVDILPAPDPDMAPILGAAQYSFHEDCVST